MRAQLKSIRWRLPLTYIGVALLAALASGVLMLLTLRSYYRQRELDYLHTNARQIGWMAQQLLQANAPDAERLLADQVVNWSFLMQVRVQVRGADGKTLADSGHPSTRQVMLVSGGAPSLDWETGVVESTGAVTSSPPLAVSGMFFLPNETHVQPGGHSIGLQNCQPETNAECQTQPTIIQYAGGSAAGGGISFTQTFTEPLGPIGVAMPLAASLYGFELEAPTEVVARSTEHVEEAITNSEGAPLGAVVLSDGPAYGREILVSALEAWAAASLMAMVLAGAAGVWMSRRITVPLLALAQVTESMAAGNLAARANAGAANEFGQLGRSFNVMAERVADTIHTLRRFVADAAHEINTPLTALQTNVELAVVAEEPLRGELLAQAQEQIERLQSLVTGLLNLSRVEGQSQTPPHEPVDLAALARTISEPYASRAEQMGLTFELELPATPARVPGDAMQLRRAIENLLDNAIKFTPAGGEVRLRVEQADEQMVVSVQDTGIGIPPEDQSLLFQRFHRGRNAAGYAGNGLGLAIVQAVVQAHGGMVTLPPTSQGTHVMIRLPSLLNA